MSDAASQLTDGLHFLRLSELNLSLFALGDVVRDDNGSCPGIELDIERRGSRLKPAQSRSRLQFVFRHLYLLSGQGTMDDVEEKIRHLRRVHFVQKPVADGRHADGDGLRSRCGRFAETMWFGGGHWVWGGIAGGCDTGSGSARSRRKDFPVTAVLIDHEHQIGNGPGHGTQPRLAFAQGDFGLIAGDDFMGERLVDRFQIGRAFRDTLFQ